MAGRVYIYENTKHCNMLNILTQGLITLKMIFKAVPMMSLWEIKTTRTWPI